MFWTEPAPSLQATDGAGCSPSVTEPRAPNWDVIAGSKMLENWCRWFSEAMLHFKANGGKLPGKNNAIWKAGRPAGEQHAGEGLRGLVLPYLAITGSCWGGWGEHHGKQVPIPSIDQSIHLLADSPGESPGSNIPVMVFPSFIFYQSYAQHTHFYIFYIYIKYLYILYI